MLIVTGERISSPSGRVPLPLVRRRAGLVGRFGRSRRGVAAVEFALVVPFLIALLLGAFETARYVNMTRRLTYAASSIAEILAQNGTGTADYTDVLGSLDSTMVTFPTVLVESHQKNYNWWNYISVSMTSVAFTPTVAGCTSGCTYKANVAWAYSSGGNYRPCATPLTPVPSTSTPSSTTLPTDVYGPGSLIVVDLLYTYTPVIASSLFGSKKLARSFYIQPRNVSLIKYNYIWGDPFIVTVCPGYN